MPLGPVLVPFDLCPTAGPGEHISVGSCGRLISPALTQAQLVDSTLWDSAGKLSVHRRINHWRGIHTGYCKRWPPWPVSLFAYLELQKGNGFLAALHIRASLTSVLITRNYRLRKSL